MGGRRQAPIQILVGPDVPMSGTTLPYGSGQWIPDQGIGIARRGRFSCDQKPEAMLIYSSARPDCCIWSSTMQGLIKGIILRRKTQSGTPAICDFRKPIAAHVVRSLIRKREGRPRNCGTSPGTTKPAGTSDVMTRIDGGDASGTRS